MKFRKYLLKMHFIESFIKSGQVICVVILANE